MEYIVMIIGAVFVNNIILAQFLGICPFLGVSSKVSTSLGMGAAVLFVMTIAVLATSVMEQYVLVPYGLSFLKTISFILIIASLVQMVEIILKKISPSLYQALGIFLPLITTNCAVLGVAILVTQQFAGSILDSVVYAIASAIGFTVAIVIFAGLREHLDLVDVPKGMRGVPIALITAGILALAFMGFANLV
ncbi:RnfABCDGE type electron transport complex subunit A [Bacteroidales bacterium OttesenSCG-928-B11]|nr:RnfABCDGE type electron transport complex subunit A [Bacteroidales bacterium OttesenSCG-928-C03]MDL2312734.1 RnfABCDGE type electron transport complex subunit A [Bacteroidales bacterium OttesenSCG-928-B11]